MITDNPNEQLKDQILALFGHSNLISLLNYSENVDLIALQFITSLVEGSPRNLEMMCLCGLIPFMMRFGSAYYSREFSVEVAFLIGQIFSLSTLA